MKILFIDGSNYRANYLNLGLGFLATYLRDSGHKIKIVSIAWDSLDSLPDQITDFDPGLIGVSALTPQILDAYKYVEVAKSTRSDVPIIFGGIHASFCPEEIISKPFVDMLCIGEGEEAMLELCGAMEDGKDISNIKNIWLKEGKKIIRNDVRPLEENLDKYPYPDRSLFPIKQMLKKGRGSTNLIASRGCPYNCTYCLNHYFQRVYSGKGKYVRFRSVSHVLKEIEELSKKYGITGLVFSDDLFICNKKYVREFCDEYKRLFDIPFEVNSRPEFVDVETLKILKDAGCNNISIGIESGDEGIRKEVLRRNYSNELVINVFKMAKEAGLRTKAYNMIGLPGEGRDEIEATFELNKLVDADRKYCKILQPYPGTDIYKMVAEKGLLRGDLYKIIAMDDAKADHSLGAMSTGKLNRYEILGYRYKWQMAFTNNKKLRMYSCYKYLEYMLLGKLIGPIDELIYKNDNPQLCAGGK